MQLRFEKLNKLLMDKIGVLIPIEYLMRQNISIFRYQNNHDFDPKPFG